MNFFAGKKIKSQYRKKAHTIRVTAFKNGTREPFVRLAAPNIKMVRLLLFCSCYNIYRVFTAKANSSYNNGAALWEKRA